MLVALVLCLLGRPASAAAFSEGFEAAAALLKADPARQQRVWNLEERVVAVTLDELLAGRLRLARSFVETARRHEALVKERLSPEQLAAAAAAVEAAETARDPLVAARVLADDGSGRLKFAHHGKAPSAAAARAYRRFARAVEAIDEDPGFAALLALSALYGACAELRGDEFSLCNDLRVARVVFEVQLTRYRQAMDGELFDPSTGLRRRLDRAVAENGGRFDGRWLGR